MDDLMIRVENIKKQYKLGQIGARSLRDELQRKVAKLRGKEDPLKKIGAADYRYGETFMALNGVSFEARRGERLGIIGHNGAGKSTLLKLLSRITAPTEGKIYLNGRVASMLEVGTGFNAELTGRENIYMNGAILGMTKAETDAKMEQIIDFSECRQFIDTPVKRYSSGMYVKLAFSVAAHLDSEIMIMDEVLAVGDMAFQKKCLDKMRQTAAEENRTVLYVSHNMNTIRTLCDRCLVMSQGRIIFDGDVEESIAHYMKAGKLLSVSYDCSDISRKKHKIDNKVHINSVGMRETDFPVYSTGEKVKLSVDFTSEADLEKVAFRIALRVEDQITIGLASSAPEISIRRGHNIVDMEFDPSSLAPGKYLAQLTAFSVNEYGAATLHDVVDDAFAFERIQNSTDNNNISWNTSLWGHIMFPQIIINK